MLTKVVSLLAKALPKSELVKFLNAARVLRWRQREGAEVIYLSYRVNPIPRYGFGKPPHTELHLLMDRQRRRFEETLAWFVPYQESLSRIPFEKAAEAYLPYWNNGFFGGLEAIALYCLPAVLQSKVCIEIGSGNSTKFVRQSIKDNNLNLRLISIDPEPRAEVDGICDAVIRCGLENVDIEVFQQLNAGDILMFDGSHYCFQNSDVAVFFLEVLPKLRSGVIVYIDDIFLPYDYPPKWADRYYSEQYLLATLLLASPERYEILLPCVFVANDEALRVVADELISGIREGGIGGYGNGFLARVA